MREFAHDLFRLRFCGRHGVLERLLAHGHAFDAHDANVRDSDKASASASAGLRFSGGSARPAAKAASTCGKGSFATSRTTTFAPG